MTDRATDRLTVLLPTLDSEGVVRGALTALHRTVERSPVDDVDDMNCHSGTDATPAIVREMGQENGWVVRVEEADLSLPAARERLLELAETEWVLFLDDDVRPTDPYLRRLWRARGPRVGAIQGRKISRTEHPSDWVRRRSRRAGTHATLVRREAAVDVDFPDDVTVLEDEWLRRHVESQGYLWSFDHQARFEHRCQGRHPIGVHEGYVAGKYDLKPFHELALNVPFAAATRRNPWPHAKRCLGWLYGRLEADRDAVPAPQPARAQAVADGGIDQ